MGESTDEQTNVAKTAAKKPEPARSSAVPAARIVKSEVVDGRIRITIAKGTSQGIDVGAHGVVSLRGGQTASFEIDEVHANRSLAFVDVANDTLAPIGVVFAAASGRSKGPDVNTKLVLASLRAAE